MRKLAAALARALGAVLAALLAALVVIAAAETLAWTLFEKSWAAASEIEGLLLVWFALLGAAWGIRQRIHLGVEALARRLPGKVRTVLGRAASAWVVVFGGLLAFYGAKLAGTVTNTLPATGLTASVQYFPAAVSGLLMVFFALEDLVYGVGEAAGRDDPGPR